MGNNKLKLLFDARILALGIGNNAGRSGIYFTTKNILKHFLKNPNLDITLFCDMKNLATLRIVSIKEFGGTKFKILSDAPQSVLSDIYSYLFAKRTIAKFEKRFFAKFFWDILVRIVKPFEKLLCKFYKINLEEKISCYDAFFSPVFKIPSTFDKLKKYTILYDIIPTLFPKMNSAWKEGSWYDLLTKSLNSNDYYFAISEYTKQDFLKYFPVLDANKITTTLLACDENFRVCTQEQINKSKEKYNIPSDKKYVFSLCTLEPRKNLIRAVKTFVEFIKKNNIEDIVFVLGGGHWDTFIKLLKAEILDLGKYQDKILKIGYVEDEDLAPLYSGAEWFVYTSQYEGFGLPPLEAMSCGCPVITSNNSSLPEVVGDVGIMVDWDSDEQHIEAYEKYYFDKNLRAENSQKGIERAKTFSWEKCANEMANIMIQNKENK
jgi:glycosyltransferase involved in cell wall biosynthesis